jgi:hypothetical protein
LNDLWEFDGASWREIGAFDPAPLLSGCEDGLFVERPTGFEPASHQPTIALLSSTLQSIDKNRLAECAQIERLREEIQNNHRELLLFIQKAGKGGRASALFGPALQSKLEEEIRELRKTFCRLGEAILAGHGDGLARPPPPPPRILAEYSARLQAELARTTAKYARRIAELRAEAKLYADLQADDSPAAAAEPQQTPQDEVGEYLEKLRRLQAQQRAVTQRERKLVQKIAQMVSDDRRMTALLSTASILAASIEGTNRDIEDEETRLVGIEVAICRAKKSRRLMRHPKRAAEIVASARSSQPTQSPRSGGVLRTVL